MWHTNANDSVRLIGQSRLPACERFLGIRLEDDRCWRATTEMHVFSECHIYDQMRRWMKV